MSDISVECESSCEFCEEGVKKKIWFLGVCWVLKLENRFVVNNLLLSVLYSYEVFLFVVKYGK